MRQQTLVWQGLSRDWVLQPKQICALHTPARPSLTAPEMMPSRRPNPGLCVSSSAGACQPRKDDAACFFQAVQCGVLGQQAADQGLVGLVRLGSQPLAHVRQQAAHDSLEAPKVVEGRPPLLRRAIGKQAVSLQQQPCTFGSVRLVCLHMIVITPLRRGRLPLHSNVQRHREVVPRAGSRDLRRSSTRSTRAQGLTPAAPPPAPTAWYGDESRESSVNFRWTRACLMSFATHIGGRT